MTRLLEPTHLSNMNIHQRRFLGASILVRLIAVVYMTGYWHGAAAPGGWIVLGVVLALWSLRDLLRDFRPTDRQEPDR